MLTIAPGWDLEVERGPEWLFVKLGNHVPADSDIPSLADEIWSILDRHFVYRVVLRLEGVRTLNRDLLRELVVLYRRIRRHGGMEEKGDSPHLCEAPSGPFRQMRTVPFFRRRPTRRISTVFSDRQPEQFG
jgi:hypothetical protein